METAHLTVAFDPVVPPAPPQHLSFDLVIEPRDLPLTSRVIYQPAVITEPIGQPGYNEIPLALMRYGMAVVRLYAPALSCTVKSLEPLREQELVAMQQTHTGRSNATYNWSSGYQGEQIVNAGRRSFTMEDRLSFKDAQSARIRHWHDNPTPEILYSSIFVDPDGLPIATPHFIGMGYFHAIRPATGSMIVRYPTTYTQYNVFYELARPVLPYIVAEDGHNWFELPVPQDPLRIYAHSDAGSHSIDVPRKIYQWGKHSRAQSGGGGGSNNNKGDNAYFTGTEVSRSVVPRRIENAADPSQYVEVNHLQSIAFADQSGRLMSLTLDPDR
jgi:hypothetical protein